MHTELLTEQDLELLHGLQIAPRVSWAEAARILGSTPETLAARWARLHSEGLAWITAHPGGDYRQVVFALVEIDCLPGGRADAVRAVCADRRVVTVEESTRGRDLVLTVITHDLADLTRLVLDELPRMPGVERQRTYPMTAMHGDGSAWRFDALSPAQELAFENAARATRPARAVTPVHAGPLIDALIADGRSSAADLARATGRNPATVRRQLGRLLSSGVLSFRCDVAQVPAQRPISSTWLVRVTPAHQKQTIEALAKLPDLRLCVSITGGANIAFTAWLRSLHDLIVLERLIGERMPWLAVIDSWVNLRTPKRMGWILDEQGRATGQVPPWTHGLAAG